MTSLPGKKSCKSWAHYLAYYHLGGKALEASFEGPPYHHTRKSSVTYIYTLSVMLLWPITLPFPNIYAWKERRREGTSRVRLWPGINNRNEWKVTGFVKAEVIMFLFVF